MKESRTPAGLQSEMAVRVADAHEIYADVPELTAQELADARIGARSRRTGRLDLTLVGAQPRSSLLLCFSGSHRPAC
jgi:hypothetical protein